MNLLRQQQRTSFQHWIVAYLVYVYQIEGWSQDTVCYVPDFCVVADV